MIDRLLEWVHTDAVPGARVLDATPLSGGFRNENLLLRLADGQQCVLRRYRQADRCAVEAALADRLAGVVPVARVIAADPTGDRAGEPVLLTEFVPGELASTVASGGEVGAALGRTLAAIGTVGFAGPGWFTGPELVPSAALLPTGLAEFMAGCLAVSAAELSPTERDALVALAVRAQPLVDAVAGTSRLVHADFNPKNLLLRRGSGGWAVAAVLDWEFAFSGHPLSDVGNLLRFADDVSPAFTAGFTTGFQAGGGELPPDWLATARALDLFALADLLTRSPDGPMFAKVVAVLRTRLAEQEMA